MAKARHMHNVSGVLLITFYLCTVTLINGSLSSLKRRQTQCICQVEKDKSVLCSWRSLDNIPSCIPADATFLDLNGNHISHIKGSAFVGMNIVATLSLSRNNISQIEDFAFAGMHSLNKLVLSRNTLTTITKRMFANLTNVNTLDLSYNRISHIEDMAFGGMHRLSTLDLSYNRISHIKDLAFDGMSRLFSLDLSFNDITRIEVLAFDGIPHPSTLNMFTDKFDDNVGYTLQRGPAEYISHCSFYKNQIKASLNFRNLLFNDNLQLDDVICALKPTDGFLLRQCNTYGRECSCHYLNFQLQAITSCPAKRNLVSIRWNKPPLCSTLNSSIMSVRCQESDVSMSSTYKDETSDVSTSSTYKDETTSDVSTSSTYKDETSDVSTSSTYKDETALNDVSMRSANGSQIEPYA